MYCGKCGKKIPDGYEYCMYCGAKVGNQNMVKKKKIFKIIISIIALIVVIGGGLFLYFQFSTKNFGYLRNTKWGMSLSEVKNTEKGNNISKDSSTLIYLTNDNVGLEKINTTVSYSFDNGKLSKGAILVFTNETGKDSQTILDSILSAYRSLYGKEIEATGYSYSWITKKSRIEVDYVTKDSIMIMYNEISEK
jgi:uncharacterized protein YxeA